MTNKRPVKTVLTEDEWVAIRERLPEGLQMRTFLAHYPLDRVWSPWPLTLQDRYELRGSYHWVNENVVIIPLEGETQANLIYRQIWQALIFVRAGIELDIAALEALVQGPEREFTETGSKSTATEE